MVHFLAVSLLALLMPAIHGQKWTKVAGLTDADKAIHVTASVDPKMYELFVVTAKFELKGFNTTTKKWVHITDGVKNFDMGYENSAWAVKKDGSLIRILFSQFGSPVWGAPPTFPDKKLVQVSPFSFEKVVGVDSSNKIWALDTRKENASWVQMEGEASWVSTDSDMDGMWGVNSKQKLDKGCCNVNYQEDYQNNGKWVSKPGGARTLDAMRTNDSNPLIVSTTPGNEIYMYSGKVFKPDHEGQVWTKLKGLMAKYCSLNDVTMFCVATNGTVYRTPIAGLADTLPKLAGAKVKTAAKAAVKPKAEAE